jgi:hypothetical protein
LPLNREQGERAEISEVITQFVWNWIRGIFINLRIMEAQSPNHSWPFSTGLQSPMPFLTWQYHFYTSFRKPPPLRSLSSKASRTLSISYSLRRYIPSRKLPYVFWASRISPWVPPTYDEFKLRYKFRAG